MNCKDEKPMRYDAAPLDLAAVRAKLEGKKGRHYWRSLEELADDPRFEEMLHREFPRHAAELRPGVDRREFLKVMGASLALAGLAGCGAKPEERIVPYVRQPEGMILGVPQYYATTMTLGGSAIGLLVETHEGRPTKIEGNPKHPASLGATDVFAQAAVLELYDPDRSSVVTYLGEIRPWYALLTEIQTALAEQKETKGAGLRFLTGSVISPTLASQMEALLAAYPAAKWHQWEAAGSESVSEGARLAFGRDVHTYYNVEKADVILSLDADFLTSGPGCLRYAREFSRRRLPDAPNGMARLYAVESMPTSTGATADHRLPLRPSEMRGFAAALARKLGIEVPGAAEGSVSAEWIAAVARDLQQHRGASVVIAGEQQTPEVHALAHAMNHALGNAGATVFHTDPVDARPTDEAASIAALAADLDAGRVQTLVILGCNPVYDAPGDLEFQQKLLKAARRIHLSGYPDETSALCHWHVPMTHFLEAWSDARTYDGTASIVQPLIAPLYGGKSAHEMIAAFGGEPEASGYDIVRAYWKKQLGGDFEAAWRRALNDGFIEGTRLPEVSVTPQLEAIRAAGGAATAIVTGAYEIAFRPDPAVYDGRFANNAWLEELPKPITRLTWDNAAMVSPKTAEALGLSYTIDSTGGEHGQIQVDKARLDYQGRTLDAATWIVPGLPDGLIVLHLGYGRSRAGKVGEGLGFNANALRVSTAPWGGPGARVRKLRGETYPLACVQFHHTMEGRELLRAGTLDEYRANPRFAPQMTEAPPPGLTLYPDEHKYEGNAWALSIDLNRCNGCNACVVACQSENNIPVVGKEQVMAGREMHWIRIDRYYEGGLENPETHFQPVTCMQCENAPCELVCPVGATNHSAEGLNDMVYNRCVGTRYCSNNCPYKVRRFNFLAYSDWDTPALKMLRNPEVTVRSRGVMEKCTYCIQRITKARIAADKEDRPVRDGEIVTACQQACPAEAIVFGNQNDRASRVAALKANPRNYGMLSELGVRPRTTYLAAVRNPNPELEKGGGRGA
ncbi:MAG: TAT-variant-translocated molybdopterin oxidoreductase [Candidatus Acidiferrales bacterium]